MHMQMPMCMPCTRQATIESKYGQSHLDAPDSCPVYAAIDGSEVDAVWATKL